MSCWPCAIVCVLLSTSTTNPWLVCLENFYSFLAQTSSSLLPLWISLELDASFPETLQVNHSFTTLYIFLSPASRFLEDTGSLPFPEPDKLLASQGLYTFSFLHLDSTLPLHLIRISTQIDCWRGLPWFSCIIQKYLSLLAPPPFIFLQAAYRV